MKNFRVYKANNSNNGSALSVDLNLEKESIFFEFANQKSEKAFDWENKLTIKLSVLEIAKIMVFYNQNKSEISLFHDPSKGPYKTNYLNAVLKISKNNTFFNFKLNQKMINGELKSIYINLNEEEMIILNTIFDEFIRRSFY